MSRPRYSGTYRRMLQRVLGVKVEAGDPDENDSTYPPVCEHWFDDNGVCRVCGKIWKKPKATFPRTWRKWPNND